MNPAIDLVLNPGQLKLQLGLLGVELDDEARRRTRLRDDGPPEQRSGIELILPEDVWVNAPLRESPRRSPFRLCGGDERYILTGEHGSVEVRLVEPPAFYGQQTIGGTAMRRIGAVHGSFISVQPDAACGSAFGGIPCAHCLRSTNDATGDRCEFSVADVTEVVRAAFAEGAAEFVCFNLGASDGEDGGLSAIEPHIRAVKSNFDTAVALQMHPPKSNRWIDEAYAMGVDAIGFSLEVFDDERLRAYCPGRAERIGRQRYIEALRHAATVFPSGTVWCELVIGLESAASTRRGVDTLVAIGVLPVLSLRASSDGAWPLQFEEMLPLYKHLFEAVRDAKINMGWIRDLCFAITPLEARFFAGDEARMTVALQHFYRSRLGQSAARSLARLRRRLRVRRVSDSFDSSHL